MMPKIDKGSILTRVHPHSQFMMSFWISVRKTQLKRCVWNIGFCSGSRVYINKHGRPFDCHFLLSSWHTHQQRRNPEYCSDPWISYSWACSQCTHHTCTQLNSILIHSHPEILRLTHILLYSAKWIGERGTSLPVYNFAFFLQMTI